MRFSRRLTGIAVVATLSSVACKTRTTDSGSKRDAADATQKPESSSQVAVDAKPSAGTFPENGSIAKGQVTRTTGNAISGRTQTGTATVIPRAASWLRLVGQAFTQLYDIHSDNFAVGSIGASGQFDYVIHLNSTLGYVNPLTMMLMYCEPQMVSQSSDAVAILDCMDAMPISKISKTAKYSNGNSVFDATGALLYEDGSKIIHPGNVWKTINGRVVFQDTTFFYGNAQVMRSGDEKAYFSNGAVAYNPVSKTLNFEDSTVFAAAAGTQTFYRGGQKLSAVTSTSWNYFYPGSPERPLLSASIVPSNPVERTTTMKHPNGTVALSANKVYRDDGSEAPVEIYGVEETLQNAVIWSASPVYTAISISQFTKEATYNVVDEYTSPTALLPGPPQDPTGLQMAAISHQNIVAQWASSGGTTAGFTYKMVPGATPPASCTGGTDNGLNMTAVFTGLTPSTPYSMRVCARNKEGQLSAGVTATATTQNAPVPPPPPPPPAVSNILKVGEALQAGQFLINNGRNATCAHKLTMAATGNLELTRAGRVIWQSQTKRGLSYVILQTDRNLVVYLKTGAATWSSRTSSATSDLKATLVLNNDGNLTLKAGDGRVVWQTATGLANCR